MRESSRGSGVFWTNPGLSQAKMLSVDCKEKAEMKSALLTADWQFQRPTEIQRPTNLYIFYIDLIYCNCVQH